MCCIVVCRACRAVCKASYLSSQSAAAGTGIALIASAVSSIIGFGIMGFAPMPMFSSYGILTATMILMAAVASLLVLPSLLLLVKRDLSETSIVGDTDAPKE